MNCTISDLWNGNIAPCEHCGAHDADANRLVGSMEHSREALWEGLTAAQKELFQKYIDCSEDYLLRMLELAFCEGFSLGSKLITEALS